jgi:hypothetical protein
VADSPRPRTDGECDGRQIGHWDPSVVVHETNQQCRARTTPMPPTAASHMGSLQVTAHPRWMMTIPSQNLVSTSMWVIVESTAWST